jgi:hypothetical protein
MEVLLDFLACVCRFKAGVRDMSIFDAMGFDGNDLSGELSPLICEVAATPSMEARQLAFCELRDRLIDHFEAVEPTLYASLRRFPHLTPTLIEADRAREDIRRCLTDLSLMPSDSDSWMDVFTALSEGIRMYLDETDVRLSEIARRSLGPGELRRLSVEAGRIWGMQAAQYSRREIAGD